MTELDRSGPVFYVRIGNAGSQTVSRLDESIRIMSITFDEDVHKQDVLTLTVDNHDLSNFDNPLFAVGNVVEACWGYPGAMSRVRECTITKVTGSLQLKVECKGKSHVANLVGKTRKFENMRRSEIAAQLAQEHGLGESASIQETPVVFDVTLQVRETDAQFLRGLAHKEGYDYYEDHSGFHFHEKKFMAKPTRRFQYFIDKKGGDVESFTVEGDFTAKPALIIGAGRDLLTKETFAPYANNDSLSGRPTTAAVAAVNFGKNGAVTSITGLNKAKGDPAAASGRVEALTAISKKDAQAQTNAATKRAEQKAVKVTLHCIGDALIEAKQVVELHSFGKTLDGNYHVDNIKHAVGPGYRMTLKLTRSGPNTLDASASGTPNTKGTPNEATGPAVADQSPQQVQVGNDASWKLP